MRPEDRDAAYLWDMLQAARDAADIVTNVTLERFLLDRVRLLALERSLELVGEAARRVSEAQRAKHARLPWKAMIGLRNILAHDYGHIDHDKLYATAVKEIPRLITALEALAPTDRG